MRPTILQDIKFQWYMNRNATSARLETSTRVYACGMHVDACGRGTPWAGPSGRGRAVAGVAGPQNLK